MESKLQITKKKKRSKRKGPPTSIHTHTRTPQQRMLANVVYTANDPDYEYARQLEFVDAQDPPQDELDRIYMMNDLNRELNDTRTRFVKLMLEQRRLEAGRADALFGRAWRDGPGSVPSEVLQDLVTKMNAKNFSLVDAFATYGYSFDARTMRLVFAIGTVSGLSQKDERLLDEAYPTMNFDGDIQSLPPRAAVHLYLRFVEDPRIRQRLARAEKRRATAATRGPVKKASSLRKLVNSKQRMRR